MTKEQADRLEQALTHHITSNDDRHENFTESNQSLTGLEPSPGLSDDEIMFLESEYQALRESIYKRLNEAPRATLFGFDDEKREELEIGVLTDIARAILLIDEFTGHKPLIPAENPKGSVGQALRERLTSD